MGKCQRDNPNSHRLSLVLCFQRADSELTSVSIVRTESRMLRFKQDPSKQAPQPASNDTPEAELRPHFCFVLFIIAIINDNILSTNSNLANTAVSMTTDSTKNVFATNHTFHHKDSSSTIKMMFCSTFQGTYEKSRGVCV